MGVDHSLGLTGRATGETDRGRTTSPTAAGADGFSLPISSSIWIKSERRVDVATVLHDHEIPDGKPFTDGAKNRRQ